MYHRSEKAQQPLVGLGRPFLLSIPDPAAEGDTDEATYAAFQRVAADLEIRVSHLSARMSTPKEDQVHVG
jgi:hypothetical protein